MSSVHKRSEALLKIHHLRRLRREASAERLMSELMVSFRRSVRVCEQKT